MSEGRDSPREEESSTSSTVATNLGWFFAGVILYVLSVGPAVLVYDGLPKPAKKAVELIYAPVVWLADSRIGEPIEWYANLWERI